MPERLQNTSLIITTYWYRNAIPDQAAVLDIQLGTDLSKRGF